MQFGIVLKTVNLLMISNELLSNQHYIASIKSLVLLCSVTAISYNQLLYPSPLCISFVYAVCYTSKFPPPHLLCQDWISFVSQMGDISTKIDISTYKRRGGWVLFWSFGSWFQNPLRTTQSTSGVMKLAHFHLTLRVPPVSTTWAFIHNVLTGIEGGSPYQNNFVAQ